MNKLILAIALAGLSLSSGCSNKSSPERLLRSFLEKMKDEDFEAAARLATQNSQEFVRELKKEKKQVQVTEEELYARKNGLNREWAFELAKAKITGNLATIIVTYKRNTGKESVSYSIKYALEKENGEWKVMMIPTPRMIYYTGSDHPFNPVRQ